MNGTKKIIALLSAYLIMGMVIGQTPDFYVDIDATGANDGTSWADAYTDLQSALVANAANGDVIWVAEGTYYPTSGSNNEISFTIPEGVSVLGGFDGTENASTFDLDDRDLIANETILSGDIDQDNVSDDDNSLHVVTGGPEIIDGLTIMHGYRGFNNYSSGIINGPGLNLSTSTATTQIRNCIIKQNKSAGYGGGESGGGVYSRRPLVIENTQLLNNQVGDYFSGNGGAIYCSKEVYVDRCIIKSNSACLGSAIYAESTFQLLNSNFISNNAVLGSTVMSAGPNGITSNIINCSFKNNTSSESGPLCISKETIAMPINVFNSILWDTQSSTQTRITNSNDITVEDCIIKGGWLGANQANILNQNPDWVDNELRLGLGSVAINAGLSSHLIIGMDHDLAGSNRVSDLEVDMGSQEFPCSISGEISSTKASCVSGDDGTATAIPTGGVPPYSYLWSGTQNQSYIAGLEIGTYTVTITDNQNCTYSATVEVEYDLSPDYFVDVNTSCTGSCVQDGSDWDHAFEDLQLALAEVGNCDQIWVAAGTYYPTSGTSQTISFNIPAGVSIFGGFDGSENPSTFDIEDRDLISNETILSGDIDQDNTLDADNSRHVLTGAPEIIDGITVMYGYRDYYYASNGAGINLGYSTTPTQIRNCIIKQNKTWGSGAGIYSNRPLNIFNSEFRGNVGTNSLGSSGGAINCSEYVSIDRCVFKNNAATFGGAIFSTATFFITNSNFISNSTGYSSAVHAAGSTGISSKVINCSFKSNYTGESVPSCINIETSTPPVAVFNSIFWGNYSGSNIEIKNSIDITVEDCIVQGGWAGTNQSNVINQNPNWADAELHLSSTSSYAIDGGSSEHLLSSLDRDLDGLVRIYGSSVDIGSMEYGSYYKSSDEKEHIDNGEKMEALLLYPNPTAGLSRVSVKENTQFQLFDSTGRLIEMGTWSEGLHTIDLSQLESGLYHLVTQGETTHLNTIAKQ